LFNAPTLASSHLPPGQNLNGYDALRNLNRVDILKMADGNAGSRQQHHNDQNFAWNPLSGAIAGGLRAPTESFHGRAPSSDSVSPDASRPQTPNADYIPRIKEGEKAVDDLMLQNSHSAETDSSSDAPSSRAAAEGDSSDTPSPDTDTDQISSVKRETDSSGKSVGWSPEKLSLATAAPKGHVARLRSVYQPDDDSEDDDNISCWNYFSSKFRMRPYEDDEPSDWWFASTAAPLLAATTAPLANVLSIAALVTPWRMNVDNGSGGIVPDFQGMNFDDPKW
jgi:hypothetical protein